MRSQHRVFTPMERLMAVLALIAAGALAVGGMAADRLFGPSLGSWGQERVEAGLPGVTDAEPAG